MQKGRKIAVNSRFILAFLSWVFMCGCAVVPPAPSDRLLRLTLIAPPIVLLMLGIDFRETPAQKNQVSAYPSVWESFDQSFYQALKTAFKKGVPQ
jgi:hypothetical protein